MKILHINANYISTRLHKILKDNLNKFISNTVYSPNRREQLRVIFEQEDNVVDSPCVKKTYKFVFKYKENVIFNDFIQKIIVSDFDLIHAHTLFTDGYIAYKAKKIYGIKYIVAVRNVDVNAFLKYRKNLKNVGIKILSEASAIVFLSEAYRDRVINKYVPIKLRENILNKTYVIPNGIDEFWHKNMYYKHKTSIKNELNLLCVGAINKNKNIISVIKALEKLNSEGIKCHLDVAGRPESEQIIKAIEKCEFAEYHGCLNKEQLIEIYRKNDIFVLPSFRETFGLVYAEAMSQGLPVIYTKGEGFDGQFEEGVVGYGVNSHSIDDICGKIKLAEKNIGALSQNALKEVKVFDWEKIAGKYVSIYKNIVEK